MTRTTDFDFNNEIISLLKKNPGKIYKMRDLAIEMENLFPKEAKEKEARTEHKDGDVSFVKQFSAELGASRKNVIMKREANIHCLVKPLRLYYVENNNEELEVNNGIVEVIKSQKHDKNERFSEAELYPILIEKLFTD